MAKNKVKKISVEQLAQLIDILVDQEYSVFGPVKRDGAVVYDQINGLDDIPVGVEDEQEGGHYRLRNAGHQRYFSYNLGPDTWKRFLFPKEEVLYSTTEEHGNVIFKTCQHRSEKRAFFGVRSCELYSIGIQDRVFIEGDFVDSNYAYRRDNLFLIAVNCTQAAATCFCVSVDSGPKADAGFDLSLTEVFDDDEHYFILEIGSEAGQGIVDLMTTENASQNQLDASTTAISVAANQQRNLPTTGLKQNIENILGDHDFWEDIANRCLNCANCTLVCPTCFCASIEERTDLSGKGHERVKHWDSCFNLDHSHIAGGSVRKSSNSRYRQWFSHKLASWQDQFDTLGCTGCGRCITWCPVGIDITAEAHRLDALTKVNKQATFNARVSNTRVQQYEGDKS